MGRTNVGTAVYRVTADTSGYQRAFDQATRSQARFQSNSSSVVSAIAAFDGPLGGIGSRVRSLNALMSSTNVLIGGLALGLTGLAFAAGKSLQEFAKIVTGKQQS